MTEDQAKARVAVALMEHAASTLARANNEGPKGQHEFGREVAAINRQIHALQARMIRIIDSTAPGKRSEEPK